MFTSISQCQSVCSTSQVSCVKCKCANICSTCPSCNECVSCYISSYSTTIVNTPTMIPTPNTINLQGINNKYAQAINIQTIQPIQTMPTQVITNISSTNTTSVNGVISKTTSSFASSCTMCNRFVQSETNSSQVVAPCVKCKCSSICTPCNFTCNECITCYTYWSGIYTNENGT